MYGSGAERVSERGVGCVCRVRTAVWLVGWLVLRWCVPSCVPSCLRCMFVSVFFVRVCLLLG